MLFRSAISLVAALAALPLLAQHEDRPKRMEGSIHRATRRMDRVSDRATAIARLQRPRRNVSLRALSSSERAASIRKPGLSPVGVTRKLPDDVLAGGEWSVTPEGNRLWRLSLQSIGAQAMRLHFTGFDVGEGKVWLLDSTAGGSHPVGPYTGKGLFNDREFWTDFVEGDSLIVAYEPGFGIGADDPLPFVTSEISHRFSDLRREASSPSAAVLAGEEPPPRAAAASCNVDVTCYAEYSEPASAVALIIFESNGSTYECSGSLVSSAAPAIPFFLTANHCIANDEEARSALTFFNYQTTACNGTAPSLSTLPRVAGAGFVVGQSMALGDVSLLRLSAFPDIDVKVLGWSSADIQSREQVIGISHPRGDFKRIAFGERTRDVTIRFSDGDTMPADKGYQVSWWQGVTQSGSSGSPLLATISGKQYLVGTLSAGPDVDEDDSAQVCRTRNLTGSYGRFSAAFPALEQYLTSSGGTSAGSSASILTATPSPVTAAAGQATGRTTLMWRASGATRVQIRVGSPNGPAMTGLEGPSGSAQTGDWVTDGMVFYLQNASDGNSVGSDKTLARVSVDVRAQGVNSSMPSGIIVASPNPIQVENGRTVGATTFTWKSSGVTNVQIRLGSPTGQILTGLEQPAGSATSGAWVRDGMVFYLQDASDGSSAGASRTLAYVRVSVVGR